MKIDKKFALILFVFLLVIVSVNTNSVTPTLTVIKTLVDAIKIGNNMIDLVVNYLPILYEHIVAAYDKEKPLPKRSYDFIVDLTRPKDIFLRVTHYNKVSRSNHALSLNFQTEITIHSLLFRFHFR